MAVDDWLLETAVDFPVLRVYEWDGDWVSFGYFLKFAEVSRQFDGQGVRLVRRATGGGVVDHRRDRTYTLVVPGREALARRRGDESYRLIHGAVVAALSAAGVAAALAGRDSGHGSELCFENPVRWDVVGPGGRKIAGAGQRRTRTGLLHQGSLMAGEAAEGITERLAAALAVAAEPCALRPDPGRVACLVGQRYGIPGWLRRR